MTFDTNELRAAIEAILFVSSEPVQIDGLVEAFGEGEREAILQQLEEIRRRFEEQVGGFMLEQAAGGWRLTTRAEHDAILKKYFARKGENRLSIAALETLAIVAYRQPVTAPEISDIRGVNSTGVIRTLLERKMIRVAGRKNVVGSPFLYRTTKEFLVHFGLNDVRDLPRLEEFGDLIGENINDDLLSAIGASEGGGSLVDVLPEESDEPSQEATGASNEDEETARDAEETQLESSSSETTND
jgi:segregation and condensation protein B